MTYFTIWTTALIVTLISSYISVKTYDVSVLQSLIINFLTVFVGVGGYPTLVHFWTSIDG